MQDWPLRVPGILDHAARWHGEREVVSRRLEGGLARSTWAEVQVRARRCAGALRALGLREGQRIGTLAWNTTRHLEAWYGIIGMGGVCHTLNPRLFPEQLAYIASHAEDAAILLDPPFAPLLEGLREKLPSVTHYVLLCDREQMPATSLPNALCYEELLAEADPETAWTEGDENAAAGLCYTSGTTGPPKGVRYSHRSNVLHALMICGADVLGLRSADSVLPVVPMFHANAWGIVFAAPMVGARLVLPADGMDGASLHELLEGEGVTFTAAVPTVWLGLLEHLESSGKTLSSLQRVVIGGSACPRVVFETFQEKYGVEVIHAWGMTELNPLGTVGVDKAGVRELPAEERLQLRLKQGRPPYTVELKTVDDAGAELPRDGRAFGHLLVRGPAVAAAYHEGEGGEILDPEGWFHTGDVATLDERGYMQITDRSKDVIKSGGEWISSIELENRAVGHPEVAEAAVIGVAHPKWGERPLLVVVRRPGSALDAAGLRAFLEDQVARWWLPDDVVFVDELPHTATGKIHKLVLRERFRGHELPS